MIYLSSDYISNADGGHMARPEYCKEPSIVFPGTTISPVVRQFDTNNYSSVLLYSSISLSVVSSNNSNIIMPISPASAYFAGVSTMIADIIERKMQQ